MFNLPQEQQSHPQLTKKLRKHLSLKNIALAPSKEESKQFFNLRVTGMKPSLNEEVLKSLRASKKDVAIFR